MEELLQLLNFITPLSPRLEKRLRKIIRLIRYRAGDVILSPGQVCQQIFFIRKGLVRIYHMLGKEEVSDWFNKEGDISISVGSFFDQVPSKEYHVALEDCECWGITFDELEETYRRFPEFNLHGRKIAIRYYIELDNRSSFLKRQDPDRKYEHLMEKNPDFLQRITNKDMASYLDIGLRSYNKIKSDYLKKLQGEAKRRRKIKD